MAKREKASEKGRRAWEVVASRPRSQGWRTTDEEEIERRRLRASQEPIEVEPLEPREGFFGTFRARSPSGGEYDVEIRSFVERWNSCDCPDYRVNGLGTCKHVEAVLGQLRQKPGAEAAAQRGSQRAEIFLFRDGLEEEVRIAWPQRSRPRSKLRALLDPYFSSSGAVLADPLSAVPAIDREIDAAPPALRRQVRLSSHLCTWVDDERRRTGRRSAKEAFLADVEAGKRSLDIVRLPLYPYQQEGMLHLAFTERALLADEMGLGKTVQAISACELLRRLRGIERVLVISPASLKAEWEEQISKFIDLPARIVQGPREARLRLYREPSFFYLTNYEQILADGEDVQRLLAPDVIILDEAQRIKNWRTKTAEAVKRLESHYAFVLTGTPLENRIDDVYSIVQFLDPQVFGPLFRFNRDFHQLDERGRPQGYKNLDELHRRLRPVMLRRRKHEVEDQLPGRTVNTYFVEMGPEQEARYDDYKARVAKQLVIARRRPLTPEEFDKLQKWLACMRMLCDTPYILDPACRECPKLGELEQILDDVLASDENKLIVFSEWQRMLELVRELLEKMSIGFAWHTGSVPQKKRRGEIRRFKEDPACRVFLSTDSGSVGLNLQAANVVINLDQPWNPAKLEQRIARAWRKHQKRAVQVIHLVSEDSIEERMLQVLAGKQLLAEGVLDGRGELEEMPLPSGRAVFVKRLEEVLGARLEPAGAAEEASPPADGAEHLHQDLAARLGERLLGLEVHAREAGTSTLLAVVDGDRGELEALRPRIQERAEKHLGGAAGELRLELLDRAAFETVQRLIEAGVLQLTEAGRRVLHSSPALEEARDDGRRRRLEPARRAVGEGERKVRMAAVLAAGGFPSEAAAPLLEGLELGLRSLATFAGLEVADGEAVPAEAVERAIAREAAELGPLTHHMLACRASWSEPGADAAVSEEEAAERARDGAALLQEIGEALEGAALG